MGLTDRFKNKFAFWIFESYTRGMDVDDISFEVSALIGKAEISMTAYLSLQVGDILLLEQEIRTPCPLKVGEQEFFKGRLGLCETHKAVLIDERIHTR